MREKPVRVDNPIINEPIVRLYKKSVVDTANESRVCLLGKVESFLEGIKIPTRFFTNGRGLK
ncbi:hypothetical protein GCM10008967_32730 [Bacillus carboniphilus]|uniref:Uncharacterized protein n=1 Tax=Bacillus carboniphilus TaxID=86663 RepID=A0ABP3G9F9_9BACI